MSSSLEIHVFVVYTEIVLTLKTFRHPKTLLSCKWMAKMHKRFYVFSWKRC